jgi:hypothetical protein
MGKKSVKKKPDVISIYFVHIYHFRTFSVFFRFKKSKFRVRFDTMLIVQNVFVYRRMNAYKNEFIHHWRILCKSNWGVKSVSTSNMYIIRLFRIMSIPTTSRLFRVLTSEQIGRRLPVFITVTTSAYHSRRCGRL